MSFMKNNLKSFFVFAAFIPLAGCVTPSKAPVVTTRIPFDAGQALAALGKGNNSIKGSALLRQKGGGVVTCAGLEVRLYPVTPYSSERISILYGSFEGGYRSTAAPRIVFEPNNDALYISATRSTTCDAQGYFRFDELKDGSFYVNTVVTWRIGQSTQGGGIVRKVTVSGGKVEEIVLSAN